MRKHKLLLAITAALSVLLSGCASVDGEPSMVNSTANPVQISNTVSAVNNENFDNPKYPGKCKIYKATTLQFNDEQLFDLFNAHPECGTPQKSEYYSDDYHRYEANGCMGFISDGDNFHFWTDKGTFYESVHYYFSHLENCDEKLMNSNEDLDFLTRDEALKAVQKELSERFGISPDDWYASEFDAVKKDGVEAFKQKSYRDAYEPEKIYEGDDLEKEKQYYEMIKDLPEDGYYYFNIKYKVGDMPIFPGFLLDIGDFSSSRRSVQGTQTYLVYGRNGIEYIGIHPVYNVDTSEYTEAELIPYDEARGLIQKKYDDLIGGNQVEVLAMHLVYLPVPQRDLGGYMNYELRPHYGFYTNETETYEGKTYDIKYITYFDAVTGEELSSEQLWDSYGREWGFDV